MIDRRTFLTTVAGFLAAPLTADAQQAGNVCWIGLLQIQTRERLVPYLKAEEGLRELGYVHVDLIVMATHGRTGLGHVVLASVAEKVVRLAPCPVLTVKYAGNPATQRGG